LDSVLVRGNDFVKDRRPPKAAALRAVLDKIANANNQHPCDQGRHPDQSKQYRSEPVIAGLDPALHDGCRQHDGKTIKHAHHYP
jgi:hypothetical protein